MDQNTQTDVNDSATSGQTRTPLTQRRSQTVPVYGPIEPPWERRAREARSVIRYHAQQRGFILTPADQRPSEPDIKTDPSDPTRREILVRRRREQEQAETHEVYFLYCCNRVKIGTSRNALRRAWNDIMPYVVAPVDIIGTIPGGTILEGRLHSKFAESRWRDEWFCLTPELRSFLCEDEKRGDRLEDAEESYRAWLEDELAELKGYPDADV